MSLTIFRLDSSKTLGSGHVQRCLTLANLLRERGAESLFICKTLEGNFCYLIEKENYPIHYISPTLNEIEDAFCVLKIILEHPQAKTIIIDHYFLGLDFEKEIRQAEIKIAVIDDLMDRQHDCDILLDQNYRQRYDSCYAGLVPAQCRKFLGPTYALLRPQFYEQQKYAPDTKTHLKNIFVFFGGSDPTGETLKFLQNVKCHSQFNFHVLLSKGNIHLEEILKIKNQNCFLYIEPENIAQLMGQCDFYIGSGGTITWERMCMKLSGAVVTIADNQIPGAVALHNDHLHLYLGTKEEVDYKAIPQLLIDLEKNSLKEINEQIKFYKTIFSEENIEVLLKALID